MTGRIGKRSAAGKSKARRARRKVEKASSGKKNDEEVGKVKGSDAAEASHQGGRRPITPEVIDGVDGKRFIIKGCPQRKRRPFPPLDPETIPPRPEGVPIWNYLFPGYEVGEVFITAETFGTSSDDDEDEA